jgi:hypothetical protein
MQKVFLFLIVFSMYGCAATQFTEHYQELEIMYKEGKLSSEQYIKAKEDAMAMDPHPKFAQYYKELQTMYKEEKLTTEQYVKAKQDAMKQEKDYEQQHTKMWEETTDKIKQEEKEKQEQEDKAYRLTNERIRAVSGSNTRISTNCSTDSFGNTKCN